MILKPLLAATIETPDDLDDIVYPVYVSPKLDGVRCLFDEKGVPHTRKGELFVNPIFNTCAKGKTGWANLDGELIIGDPTDPKAFSATSGWLRQENPTTEPVITFWVFDRIDPMLNFANRTFDIPEEDTNTSSTLHLKQVTQTLCQNKAEVMALEDKYVSEGYEGIIVRGKIGFARYKHGRASMLTQELMKYKRFEDTEGRIIGFEEQQSNNNEKTRDAFGNAKRSSAKSGKVGNGRAGKLIVECADFAEPVIIGTGKGLTIPVRRDMWNNQERYIGRTVTFWYQKGSDYVKPRFPSFKGFRDDGI